ncbi:MAG: LysR family transcriptional regulator [Anaerolineales bacterium]|nr:LysR family transcriptional regulator [Anaerolineales bacterium]
MTDTLKLETFIRAAESLSFSEAAKQLHLAQPTISYHIKSLEKEMGVTLFNRSKSRLQLTEAARLLLPWARKLVNQSNEMQDMLSSLQDGVVGQLRIACTTTAGKYILPLLAARFCHRYPGIQVQILRCTNENVAPLIVGNEANLGVVSSEVLEGQIEYQEFFNDSIILIVPRDHPFAIKRIIEPDDLINEPLIIREATSGTRRVMLSELAKFDIGLDDLNFFMELGNAEAIVRTVASGYGISFVSSVASSCPLERGYVVEVKVRGFNLQRKIYMVRKRLEEPHRAQEAFWSFVHNPINEDLLKLADV